MNCHQCGSKHENIITDLPFKTDEHSIVIIKNIPVLQCTNCQEYVLDDLVMEKVDNILDGLNKSAELEILSYAV